jgi:hypothetical protein
MFESKKCGQIISSKVKDKMREKMIKENSTQTSSNFGNIWQNRWWLIQQFTKTIRR